MKNSSLTARWRKLLPSHSLKKSTNQRQSSIFSWVLRGFGISCQALKPCLWRSYRITSRLLVFPRCCWISWLSCVQLIFRRQDPSVTMSFDSWDKASSVPPADLASQLSRFLFQLHLTKASDLPRRRDKGGTGLTKHNCYDVVDKFLFSTVV